MTTNQTTAPIRLDVSKQGRSVRLTHPALATPQNIRLSNADRSKMLDLIRQRQLRRAILFVESLLLLQTKEGANHVRRSNSQ